jgi:hypothetical protein
MGPGGGGECDGAMDPVSIVPSRMRESVGMRPMPGCVGDGGSGESVANLRWRTRMQTGIGLTGFACRDVVAAETGVGNSPTW